MASSEYAFEDRWLIPHQVEVVWPRIVDSPNYPEWWGEVYDVVEPLNDLPADCVGSRAKVVAHGLLPYRIRFEAEITEVQPPRRLGFEAVGDLNGIGLWRLSDDGQGTEVVFEWRVRATKPVIRLLSPILRPVFAWNHRWTMDKGEAALKRLLASTP